MLKVLLLAALIPSVLTAAVPVVAAVLLRLLALLAVLKLLPLATVEVFPSEILCVASIDSAGTARTSGIEAPGTGNGTT